MPYLDHCATTPLDSEVREAMDSVSERIASGHYANPSSVHAPGRRARSLLNESRAAIAALIGAVPSEIIFTASGSEANNLAIKGAALAAYPGPFHLIVSAVEHDCVRRAAHWLAGRFDWVRLREAAADESGIVTPEAVARACESGASLVSVMMVNNETGVLQPVEEIARVARRRGALFHTDAVQALGRLPLDVKKLGCDFLTLSAHKIHGPTGAGLLYARKGAAFEPLIHGGHQEGERRAGTENPAAIAGFACAMRLAERRMDETMLSLIELERTFMSRLVETGTPFTLNGSGAGKVPGVLNLSLPGMESMDLVAGMDLAGYAISAGAACSSGVIEPSHVLSAMGLEEARIRSGIRISFGRGNTGEEAANAADALNHLFLSLRRERSGFTESKP